MTFRPSDAMLEPKRKVSATIHLLDDSSKSYFEPKVDYDMTEPSDDQQHGRSHTDALQRMNTLEYFKQVPRNETVLKGVCINFIE